jgi:hypothetical protein
MRRRTVSLSLSIVLVVPLMLLTACGGSESEAKEPPPSPAPTSVSPTASPTPSVLPTTRGEAKTLHLSVLGDSAAKTTEEKAVVAAWMKYWQAVSDTYYFRKRSPDLDVATGTALSDPLNYLAKLKTKHERVAGWARDNILAIVVKGNDAALHDCAKNFSFNVNASGEPIEKPPPYLNFTGTFVKKSGRWVVTTASAVASSSSCMK